MVGGGWSDEFICVFGIIDSKKREGMVKEKVR